MQATRRASLISDTRPRLHLILGIALVAWLVDQGTKLLAVSKLEGHDPVPVLGPLLHLTLTRNAGAAFSTGTSMTLLISIFACLALLVVGWFATRVTTRGWAWAIGLLLAGIGGNLTDRIFRDPSPLRGHVIDFLQLPNWPIFNVADVCINLGAALIVLQALRGVAVDGHADRDRHPDQLPGPGAGPQ